MLATAHAFTIDGFQTHHVTVEVDVRPGLPAFVIVGLADTAVREARERIASAIRNSGLRVPVLAGSPPTSRPPTSPRLGPGLDLAAGVRGAGRQRPAAGRAAEQVALAGELGLDGSLRPTRGTLAIAQAARRRAGLRTLVLAPERSHEARLVEGLEIAAVGSLRSAVRLLCGDCGMRSRRASPPAWRPRPEPRAAPGPDLGDVRGQRLAVRALVIAAAGCAQPAAQRGPGHG